MKRCGAQSTQRAVEWLRRQHKRQSIAAIEELSSRSSDNFASVQAAPAVGAMGVSVKKYHLVEAEEVPDAPQSSARPSSAASAAAAAAAKKKGKTSWSQFPLDEDDAASDRTDDHAAARSTGFRGAARGGARTHTGSGRSFNGGPRSGGGGRGSRRSYDSNGAYVNGVYVPNTDPKLTAQWAKSQMYVDAVAVGLS